MKILNAILILAFACTSVGIANAADAPAPAAPATGTAAAPIAVDPTITFFISLSSCVSGDYKERNILAATSGPEWLQHQIIGIDDQGYCHALLATPDGRNLECYFDPYDLTVLSDQHFINGILVYDAKGTSKEGIAAEKQWSELKDQNCGIWESQS